MIESLSNAQLIYDAIQQAKSIVITSHRSPDGDSVGSSMAFYHLFKKWGKNVIVVHPDATPKYISWVPGSETIVVFDEKTEEAKQLLNNSDLILSLDYNDLNRMGKDMAEVVQSSTATKIMFDHHLYPVEFYTLGISEPQKVSTTVVQYEWLKELNVLDHIDETIGTCLYLGTMTDSGCFRFNTVNAAVHHMIGDLLERGVVHTAIHEQTFDTSTVSKLKLTGYALSEKLQLINQNRIAFLDLSMDELNRFNYEKGDTEGLVNQMLGIQGVKMAVMFTEADDRVKISFRSKGDVFVNEFARTNFEGGGHAYASGGVSFLSLKETIHKFVTLAENLIL